MHRALLVGLLQILSCSELGAHSFLVHRFESPENLPDDYRIK
jgi:hypothetical protein